MKNPLDEISQRLEEASNLDPGEVERGRELGKEILEISEMIEGLMVEEDELEKFRSILSNLELYSSKLSKDLKRSDGGPLSSEWRQFAIRDLSRLEDEIMALQEFISERETTLRKRFNEREHGIDLRDLSRRVESEEVLEEVTRSKLSSLIDEMDEEEIQEETREMSGRLNRISKWLLALKEVRSEGKV